MILLHFTYPCFDTQAWPRDALEAVARKALRQAELSEAERETLVALCQDFHRKASGLQHQAVHAQWPVTSLLGPLLVYVYLPHLLC